MKLAVLSKLSNKSVINESRSMAPSENNQKHATKQLYTHDY